MNYEDRDTYGMYRGSAAAGDGEGPGPGLMGADTLIGNDVRNADGDELGEIKEIMLDVRSGRVAYAVLSFGGFLGMGERLFAVPWSALTLDPMNRRFVLNVDPERLKGAPGFDSDNWPDMAPIRPGVTGSTPTTAFSRTTTNCGPDRARIPRPSGPPCTCLVVESAPLSAPLPTRTRLAQGTVNASSPGAPSLNSGRADRPQSALPRHCPPHAPPCRSRC